MAKPKACKQCRAIHSEEKCPKCGNTTVSDTWKGKIEIFDPEKSEIAKQLKITEKGLYAVKS